MTFNQWQCGKQLDNESQRAFEAVWNELLRLGCPGGSAKRLLDDVYASASANDCSWDDDDDYS